MASDNWPVGCLGRRELKGFAYSLPHRFSVSAAHYAWAACYFKLPKVTVELLNKGIRPREYRAKRNLILADERGKEWTYPPYRQERIFLSRPRRKSDTF